MVTCTECLQEAVQNQANNKTFYYCRNCKEEVYENPLDNPKVQKEYNDWMNCSRPSHEHDTIDEYGLSFVLDPPHEDDHYDPDDENDANELGTTRDDPTYLSSLENPFSDTWIKEMQELYEKWLVKGL